MAINKLRGIAEYVRNYAADRIIGAFIVAASVLLTYRYAERFADWIGHRGMMIVLRLSAFIVLSIGVQIAWNGIKALLLQVGIPTHAQ